MEISNELLAAYAAGNVSDEERLAVRQYLIENPNEMESLLMMMDEDYELELDDNDVTTYSNCHASLGVLLQETDKMNVPPKAIDILPITARAASVPFGNQCVIRCEGYALRKLGFDISDEQLIEEATELGHLHEDGISLYNIGQLAGKRGFGISRRYNCTLDTLKKALKEDVVVIAVVDGGELTGDFEAEWQEDNEQGPIPDHAIVVEKIEGQQIVIYDPTTSVSGVRYDMEVFMDAWADSAYHLTVITREEDYEPHPVDLSDVVVPPELIELQEAIAENAHEVWALSRKKEGWTYGEKRDDEKKLHPDMIAYNRLPESEKAYDREMAMNTIKLVQKLGWEIKKKDSK